MDKQNPGRILIIDEDLQSCADIQQMLGRNGYSVEVATAIDSAEERMTVQHYALVISNLPPGGRSTIKLLNFLKGTDLNIPAILLCEAEGTQTGASLLKHGVYTCLTKPISPDELLGAVSSAIITDETGSANISYQQQLELLVKERTQKLAQAEKELLESQADTIHRLARATEFRDNETAEHNIRMGHYCYVLAKNLKLPASFCEKIKLASPLHDVGKIGISDTILLKPGYLTDKEFEIIQMHPEIGYRILNGSKSKLLIMAATIALTHHEKFDGTGYPYGLKGEWIPVEGRIAAICDVFDALTSDRIYKKAAPVDRAIEIMKQGSGNQFDPVFLERFFDSIDQILVMKEKFADKPIPRKLKRNR